MYTAKLLTSATIAALLVTACDDDTKDSFENILPYEQSDFMTSIEATNVSCTHITLNADVNYELGDDSKLYRFGFCYKEMEEGETIEQAASAIREYTETFSWDKGCHIVWEEPKGQHIAATIPVRPGKSICYCAVYSHITLDVKIHGDIKSVTANDLNMQVKIIKTESIDSWHTVVYTQLSDESYDAIDGIGCILFHREDFSNPYNEEYKPCKYVEEMHCFVDTIGYESSDDNYYVYVKAVFEPGYYGYTYRNPEDYEPYYVYSDTTTIARQSHSFSFGTTVANTYGLAVNLSCDFDSNLSNFDTNASYIERGFDFYGHSEFPMNVTSGSPANTISVDIELLQTNQHYSVRPYIAVHYRDGWMEQYYYGDYIGFETDNRSPIIPSPSEAVDLGLSVKWARVNYGGYAPQDFGTKVVYENFATKEYVRDVIAEEWGETWRTPTVEEARELLEKCTIERMPTVFNVYKVTGPNGNYIYMNRDVSFGYFTSSFNEDPTDPFYGRALTFHINEYNKYIGEAKKSGYYRGVTE